MPDSKLPATNAFTDSLIVQLQRHPKRIVFTEGEDLRIIQAAAKLVSLEAVAPILLGSRERIKKIADEHGISMSFIRVIDPATSSDLPLFVKRSENMARYRKGAEKDTAEILARPHYFAAMMVQYGHADGLVGGNQAIPATFFRALLRYIKPQKQVARIFGVSIITSSSLPLLKGGHILFFADTALNPDPSVSDMATIAVETGKLARHILGRAPNISLLSHSTKGTSTTKEAQKVVAATAQAKSLSDKEFLDLKIDGELQADVALDPKAAEIKLPDAPVREPADVLVFPNLDAAHISLKLLQHVAGSQNYGKIILGLSRPAAQLPRTASAEFIFGTAAAVGLEAIKYHLLYPESDF